MENSKYIKIGLIGLGTVGSGVYKTLQNSDLVKITKIAVPSQCNTFTEQNKPASDPLSIVASQTASGESARRYSHMDKMNVAYVDGHVATYFGKLPTGTLDADGNIFWYGNSAGTY